MNNDFNRAGIRWTELLLGKENGLANEGANVWADTVVQHLPLFFSHILLAIQCMAMLASRLLLPLRIVHCGTLPRPRLIQPIVQLFFFSRCISFCLDYCLLFCMAWLGLAWICLPHPRPTDRKGCHEAKKYYPPCQISVAPPGFCESSRYIPAMTVCLC